MTPRDPGIISMSRLTEPCGQSRDGFEIFKGIAREMDREQEFTQRRAQRDWQRWIYDQTIGGIATDGNNVPDYDDFLDRGWFKLNGPSEPIVMSSDFRSDPQAYPLATPSGKIDSFSQTVADFSCDDCPGHPVWLEPYEWLGKADSRSPLHLIPNQPKDMLRSQLDHGDVSKATKVASRAPLHVHPDDAAARGVQSGDVVRLFNDRGSCLGGVVIDSVVRNGVVQMSAGAWYDPADPAEPGSMCKHGNPNVLTRDKRASKLGQGPSAHSCLIEVECYEEVPLPVTAHQPPVIIRPETSAISEVNT